MHCGIDDSDSLSTPTILFSESSRRRDPFGDERYAEGMSTDKNICLRNLVAAPFRAPHGSARWSVPVQSGKLT